MKLPNILTRAQVKKVIRAVDDTKITA